MKFVVGKSVPKFEIGQRVRYTTKYLRVFDRGFVELNMGKTFTVTMNLERFYGDAGYNCRVV